MIYSNSSIGSSLDLDGVVRSRVLNVVVEHVQKQFEELAEATREIPGFHQDILPKFSNYVTQVRSTANDLELKSSPSSAQALTGLREAVTRFFTSFPDEDLTADPHSEKVRLNIENEVQKALDAFVRDLEEKANVCGEDLADTVKNLRVLEDHMTLVELSNQLNRWTDEQNIKFITQDQSIRAAQVQLANDIATLVKASEVDVKKVQNKMKAKQAGTALSPPTFKDTPSPPKPDIKSVSRQDRPSIPALWAAEVQPATEKLPPNNLSTRVTFDNRRPFKVNIFADDDDEEEDGINQAKRENREKFTSHVMKPKLAEHLLSSQLTFRQKLPKVASPRFGKADTKMRKPPSNPVTAVKKITKVVPPKRLSLGAKMARRSISTNAWSDD